MNRVIFRINERALYMLKDHLLQLHLLDRCCLQIGPVNCMAQYTLDPLERSAAGNIKALYPFIGVFY